MVYPAPDLLQSAAWNPASQCFSKSQEDSEVFSDAGEIKELCCQAGWPDSIQYVTGQYYSELRKKTQQGKKISRYPNKTAAGKPQSYYTKMPFTPKDLYRMNLESFDLPGFPESAFPPPGAA